MDLVALGRDRLDKQALEETFGVVLKDRDDIDAIRGLWLESLLESLDGLDAAALRQEGDAIAEKLASAKPRWRRS